MSKSIWREYQDIGFRTVNLGHGFFGDVIVQQPYLIIKQAFDPQFIEGVTVQVAGSGGPSYAANPTRFATIETAVEVANRLSRYGAGGVIALNFLGQTDEQIANGALPVTSGTKELWVVFHEVKDVNGKVLYPTQQINAGLLADEWRRNPEDKFPGVAEAQVKRNFFSPPQ